VIEAMMKTQQLTSNHNLALDSYASIFIIRCPQFDPNEDNIDKLIVVKNVRVGNNINLGLILDGGNPNPPARVIVDPNAVNLTATLTELFGPLGQQCLMLKQPTYSPPIIHPEPFGYNPSTLTYHINSLDHVRPHSHFKLVRVYSDDSADIIAAPTTNEGEGGLCSIFPRTNNSQEIQL